MHHPEDIFVTKPTYSYKITVTPTGVPKQDVTLRPGAYLRCYLP